LPVVALSLVAALAATAAVAAPAGKGNGGGSTGTTGNSGRHQLTGTMPTWTAAVKKTGAVAASARTTAKVWLAPRNQAQLAALAKAVSDPASSQYHSFLSHGQYVAQYAPTSAQVSAVTSWLKSAKLSVTQVGPDNHFLAVSGTASAMASAFGTQLSLYAVNGQQVQAPSCDLSVPDSLAGSVLAITGLTPLGHQVSPSDLGAPAAFVNGTPCSAYYGEQKAQSLPKFQNKVLPYAVCGYVPSQLRGAYGVDGSGYTGAGQTVAITDAFDASTLLSDANTYATRNGDAAFASGQFSDRSVPEATGPDPNNPGHTYPESCGGNGWYGEQTLDIEAVHGMAPGANVAYYGAASCYDDDLLAQLAQVVTDDDASIVTNSWGEPTFVVIGGQLYITIDQTLVDAYESIFMQGAVQGIGFYFSSGDNGDEYAAYGYSHPDFPTGDPWVTSVGGTSLAVGRSNTRLFETGWGTSKWSLTADGSAWTQSIPFQYGAGGGYSQVFPQPWYQDGVVTSNPTGGRAVPDIAMDADPTTGMLIGETQDFPAASRFGPAGVHYGEYRIGGTSLASPLLAGAQAVAQQGAGQRIGFANPLIYGLKAQSNGSSSYYDVKGTQPDPGNVRSDYVNGINADNGFVYSVRTFDQDSSLQTDKGWDDVTGVGTVTDRYIRRVAGQ
jgi:subtilase family serine protease